MLSVGLMHSQVEVAAADVLQTFYLMKGWHEKAIFCFITVILKNMPALADIWIQLLFSAEMAQQMSSRRRSITTFFEALK